MLNATLNSRGMDDIAALDFSPVSKPFPIFDNGTSFCPLPGEKVDGRLVDVGCATDQWEICVRNALLSLPSTRTEPCAACPSGKRFAGGVAQAQFVAFLACFEGSHHANMSDVDTCARANPLVQAALQPAAVNCFQKPAIRRQLWKAENRRPGRGALLHFPTVLVDGTDVSPWRTNTSLISAICAAYKGSSRPGACDMVRVHTGRAALG